MRKKNLILLAAFLVGYLLPAVSVLHANSNTDLLPDERVGVAFLEKETPADYLLKIVFPINNKTGCPGCSLSGNMYKTNVKISGDFQAQIFDSNGPMGLVKLKEIPLQFWCENDGGVQFRPTILVSVAKQRLSRTIKKIAGTERIVAFVVLKSQEQSVGLMPISLNPNMKVRGDSNGDGIIDVAIKIEFDAYSNCDPPGDPRKDLTLEVGNKSYPLRCCGP